MWEALCSLPQHLQTNPRKNDPTLLLANHDSSHLVAGRIYRSAGSIKRQLARAITSTSLDEEVSSFLDAGGNVLVLVRKPLYKTVRSGGTVLVRFGSVLVPKYGKPRGGAGPYGVP